VSDADFGEELVRLASADNFRDVTGPDSAYVAADGRSLRRGVLYRSNELQLTHSDAESLVRLGLTTSKVRTFAPPRTKRITGFPLRLDATVAARSPAPAQA